MSNDPFEGFKAKQREIWSFFAPLESMTAVAAAQLVKHARIRPGQRVLDVGSGTGVVAITAARLGAKVVGSDLTPALLERAREHSKLAELEIEWKEADAEALPFADASFDVVVSQFGHMFAPRAELALAEMLRVLKPGGTIAFSTWPPEHFVGRFFALTGSYAPPPPPGFCPPPQWGDVTIVKQRLGDAVTDVLFGRGIMNFPLLSLYHYNRVIEETVGPARALVQSGDAAMLTKYRAELRDLAADYYVDNELRQDYLMTRAIKR